jgi:hypothetical protein
VAQLVESKVDEKVQGMEKYCIDLMKQWTSYIPATLTRVELVDGLVHRDELRGSTTFDGFLQQLRVSWRPAGLDRKEFPPPESKEPNVCQSFVVKILARFTGGTAQVTETRAARPKRVAVPNVPITGSHKRRSVGRARLDVPFYDGVDKQGPHAITFVGNVNGGGYNFTKEEQGRLVDILMRVMKQQPLRRYLIGFLTDGRRFWFLRCNRNEKAQLMYSFVASVDYTGVLGWQVTIFCEHCQV